MTVTIDERSTECRDYPAIPSGTATDVEVAVFNVRAYAAWEDCSMTLSELRGLLEIQGVDIVGRVSEQDQDGQR